jgi:hypothetical protein
MNSSVNNIDLNIIWNALHSYREDCIPEGEPTYDREWDEICTQMAWIHETFGIDYDDPIEE